MDDGLIYSSDIARLIQDAREYGMTDEEIVRTISQGRTYSDVREIAVKWAPYLGWTVSEFLSVARPKRKGTAG